MNANDTRERLIHGTIRVIARDGLDRATTKNISLETGINETYIYRCFDDKTDLFVKVFSILDRELIDVLMDNVYVMNDSEVPLRERFRILYSRLWEFLLGNEDKCKCYVTYYYSPYLKNYSYREHLANYKVAVQKISVVFKEEANVLILLNHALHVLLDLSINVYDGVLPDNDDTEEHVFRLIYGSLQQYFKVEEG
jgi:AcrR family transcriptional regulator